MFSETHQFQFDDIEEDSKVSISEEQAKSITDILTSALENNKSVIVHCHAGLCRSGAVAEVGVMMGFVNVGNLRIPNLRVKKMLLSNLYEEGYDE